MLTSKALLFTPSKEVIWDLEKALIIAGITQKENSSLEDKNKLIFSEADSQRDRVITSTA